MRKTEEIKNEIKKNNKFIQNLQNAEQWLKNSKDEKWERFKAFCEEIKAFDELESHILISKGF